MRAATWAFATPLVVVVLSGMPRIARAEPTDLSGVEPSFSWDAPQGCPTSADVEARIAQRLQRTRGRRVARAFVTVERAQVRVRLVDGEAERFLVAPTCEAAADAVAIVVALASGGDERSAEAAPAPPPPFELSRPDRSTLDTRPPGERDTARWFGALDVAVAIDTASLPLLSPGVSLGAEARRGALAGGVRLGGFLAQSSRSGPTRGIESAISLFEAMVTSCVLAPLARVAEVGGCVGAGAGLLAGSSSGVENPGTGTGFRPQGEVLGRAGIALTSALWIRLDSGIVIDPVRSPFRIGNVGEVHQPAAAAFRTSAGLEIRIR